MIRDAQKRLRERVLEPDETYDNLLRAHELLSSIYGSHGQATSRFVGGMIENRVPLTPVSGDDQRRAMALLNSYFFAPDAFIHPAGYFAYSSSSGGARVASTCPPSMPTSGRCHRKCWTISWTPRRSSGSPIHRATGTAIGIAAMLHDLSGAIFAADAGGQANSFRQSLQVNYVWRLIEVYEGTPATILPAPSSMPNSPRCAPRRASGRGAAMPKPRLPP